MKQIFKSRIALLLITYIVLLLLFVIQKPVFLLFHLDQSASTGIVGWFDVICAGFSMDMSVAGYFSAVPAILLLVFRLFAVKGLKQVLNIYFAIISILTAIIFVPDIVLYSYWGFRIDSTVFTYITSPVEAAASTLICNFIGNCLRFAIRFCRICDIEKAGC